jgi:hypothetical protein
MENNKHLLFDNLIIKHKNYIEQIVNNGKHLLKRQTPTNSDLNDVVKAKILYKILEIDIINNYLKTNVFDKDRIKRLNDHAVMYLEMSSKINDNTYLQTAENVKKTYEMYSIFLISTK